MPAAGLARCGHQGVAGCIDSDPVVGELQVRRGLDEGHVAAGAGLGFRQRAGMAGRFVAVLAGVLAHRLGAVGVVARQAGEAALAFAETGALGERQRLMAGVPGVIPVRVLAGLGRLAVAVAAEFVEAGSVQHFGLEDVGLGGGLGVVAAGAVAGLASYAELLWLDALRRGQAQGAGGVALETFQDLSAGVVDPVRDTGGVLVAGG